ncbi:hypothetical protein [Sphingobacterium chuzhouense]|uniref:FecR protein domain-containing protein n=1 Tax=Sphingobacterium chuzhouense TaxID=1742264 RepID=A0ABR7XS14_9SPHI|nr:hypothetical protein [Sphingobacterium chuzhouense]MBD1421966.1 hypothetical protein [Sphingobacterium chuzhouense]
MEINQDILHKYTAGQCSEDEKLLVEKWLENDSWDSIDETNTAPSEIGQTMWVNVSTDTGKTKKISWLRVTAAASIVVLFGISLLHFKYDTRDAHSFANESFDQTKFFAADHYDVLLSGNTKANIDLINNKLTFTGDLIIKPKRNFTLLDADQNTLNFKAGREYFISDSPDFGKIVVFQKSDLAFLPSNMQIKIKEQFRSI